MLLTWSLLLLCKFALASFLHQTASPGASSNKWEEIVEGEKKRNELLLCYFWFSKTNLGEHHDYYRPNGTASLNSSFRDGIPFN